MTWEDVAQAKCVKSTTEQFMCAVIVWLKKPHVVNRRLCGTELKWFMRVPQPCEGISDVALRLRTLINSVLSPRLTIEENLTL